LGLERKRSVSLAHWVVVIAQERGELVEAEGTEVTLVPHKECLIIFRGSGLRTSATFVWPCGFRLAARRDIEFVIGDEVVVVPMECREEVKRLFGDAVDRMVSSASSSNGSRRGFVDKIE
jgi:hypothetical protein